MSRLRGAFWLAVVSIAAVVVFGGAVDKAHALCFGQNATLTCSTTPNCADNVPCNQGGAGAVGILYGDCPVAGQAPTPTPDVFDLNGNVEYFAFGRGGRDLICGSFREDTLDGGNGADAIDGEGNDDSINGGAGNDRLFGGDGDDTISGGAGNDTIEGNSDDDTISGNAGDDNIEGNGGDDTLNGNGGDDELFGGFGEDGLTGGAGFDICEGGPQDDSFASSCEITD